MFCSTDDTANIIWFDISYVDTISSQADITRFFADNNVNIRFGYLDNTEHAKTGKYIIFTQVEKSVDVDKLVVDLKGLDVVHDVEYGISSCKMVQSVEFPLNLLGERAIIARATTFVDIIRTLYENVSQSDGLLMLSGLKGGINAARYFKGITTIDENNFKDILKELFMATGWGILDIECNCDIMSGRIFVHESFIADSFKKSERPVCGYMSGYFAGFITEVVGKTMQVREVRCKSMGHDVCEHTISLAPQGAKLEHLLRGESI
ncbi:MAG: V4R domain-containing protein [Methanosarcinaceae archaeon]|nr:V4R domain-containing protein [Methanosarcinaceae archaeon]